MTNIKTPAIALGFAVVFTASANANIPSELPSSVVSDRDIVVAQTNGQERRDDRQDNRGERIDDRQDCRQEEGVVGKDKRDCKQDERQDRVGGDADASDG